MKKIILFVFLLFLTLTILFSMVSCSSQNETTSNIETQISTSLIGKSSEEETQSESTQDSISNNDIESETTSEIGTEPAGFIETENQTEETQEVTNQADETIRNNVYTEEEWARYYIDNYTYSYISSAYKTVYFHSSPLNLLDGDSFKGYVVDSKDGLKNLITMRKFSYYQYDYLTEKICNLLSNEDNLFDDNYVVVVELDNWRTGLFEISKIAIDEENKAVTISAVYNYSQWDLCEDIIQVYLFCVPKEEFPEDFNPDSYEINVDIERKRFVEPGTDTYVILD